MGIVTKYIPRDAEEAREQAAGIMPGNGKMGWGYDVTGVYCAPQSIKRPILDLGAPTKLDPASGLKVSEPVDVTSATSGAAADIAASSLRDYASTFSGSFHAAGGTMFFSGEIDASFDTSQRRITATSFVKHDLELYYWTLTLPTSGHLVDRLTETARSDFAPGGKDPAKLVEEYGTHYLSKIIVGGRASFCCTVDMNRYDSQVSLKTAAQVSARSATGHGTGGFSAAEQKAGHELTRASSRIARVVGGDPQLVRGLFEPGGFDAWAQSVPDNMQLSDCTAGLTRISELVTDTDRRAEIDRAIDAHLSGYSLPPYPDVATVFAFHADAPSRWFYTLDRDETPAGFTEVKDKCFYALTQPRDGSVPIYRQDASDPTRFRLSADPSDTKGGWKNATLAFHAWPTDAGDRSRSRICACRAKNTEAVSGWLYAFAGAPKNWIHEPGLDFYVPKSGTTKG